MEWLAFKWPFFIRNEIGHRSRESMQNRNAPLDPKESSAEGTGMPVHSSLFTSWRLPHLLIIVVLSLFCLNVALLSIIGSYDIRLGWIHLTAHGLFKPLLMMNSCFILALMICGASLGKYRDKSPGFVEKSLHSTTTYLALLLALVISLLLTIYYGSAAINFSHHDWTHRHISADIDSLSSLWELFTTRRATGFHRPLTYISLWTDYRLFGTDYTGYHIQSIAFHGINSLLVAWLAVTLGFSRINSLWSGLLFVAAAVSFEAVLWPAARFDLLATMFTLLALIVAVKYFRDTRLWFWALPVSLFFYMAGIMNKESAYSFALLISLVIVTHRLWSIPRPVKKKVLLYFSLVVIVTLIMIFFRVVVYGNLGGYPTAGVEESVHFKIEIRSFYTLLRAVVIPIFGVNTASASPGWLRIVLIAFALFIFVSAIAGRGRFGRKEYALVACTLLASVPVVNLVGWIGTSMLHSRYLYMPAVFAMLLMVSILGKIRWSAALLGMFLAINTLGAMSNIWIQRDMLARTESLAESVRSDWLKHPTAQTISLVDFPEHPSGVFYFAHELVEKINRKIPDATVLRQGLQDFTQSADAATLAYKWNDTNQTLDRVQ